MPTTLAPPPAGTAAAGLARVTRMFHALTDETRLQLIDLLRGGERCVCELQDALDAQQSRLSFHLKVLKDAGLVTDRKEGRWSYYQLNPDAFDELQAVVGALPSTRLTVLARRGAPGGVASTSGGAGCCG